MSTSNGPNRLTRHVRKRAILPNTKAHLEGRERTQDGCNLRCPILARVPEQVRKREVKKAGMGGGELVAG